MTRTTKHTRRRNRRKLTKLNQARFLDSFEHVPNQVNPRSGRFFGDDPGQ